MIETARNAFCFPKKLGEVVDVSITLLCESSNQINNRGVIFMSSLSLCFSMCIWNLIEPKSEKLWIRSRNNNLSNQLRHRKYKTFKTSSPFSLNLEHF